MSKPKISIVLGSYNQLDVIKRVLVSFETQGIEEAFEVIVVDSSSNDGSQAFLKSYSPRYLFRPIIQDNKGKAAARNTGVKAASADLILITDSDMIAHPDLLQTHIDAHDKSPTASCFEGRTFNLTELHWPPDDAKLYPYITKAYQKGDKLGWFYFLTGNLSFPKSVFEAEGGFDESFESYGWEDLELGYRLSQKKVPLYFLPDAINYHYHVLTKTEEIQRCVAKGESAKRLMNKHPKLRLFLGMNPLSLFVFPRIKETGLLIRTMWSWLEKGGKKADFSFWFLKEYHYLKGALSKNPSV